MHVVKISTAGKGNCAEVNRIPYVYASTEFGDFVLPARCPHRGGPLHLAQVEAESYRLVCPWHGRATSVRRLARRGIPAVRRGDEVSIVFPGDASADCAVTHRPLSAGLRFDARSDT
ncbi:MAG: Rieske 2Fe-2S domain-containing protein [Jatrophihabitantaceae bacterium]